MFTKNYTHNSFTLLTVFTVFGLAIFAFGVVNAANAQITKGTYLDFTGDGKTDWAVISGPQTLNGAFTWKILGNQTGSAPHPAFIRVFDYGLLGDSIIPGDYTGDRKTEVAVHRPSSQIDGNATFYIAQFPLGTGGITLERVVYWGGAFDNYPFFGRGDYDGDGKLDYTVVRGLKWYILSSGTNTMRVTDLGYASAGYAKNGADFTGNGRDELVFFNVDPIDNHGAITYYVADAITGAFILSRQWGSNNTDFFLPPADYTGDGKADFVAIRHNVSPMVWYILDPANNTATATQFGIGSETGGGTDDVIQGDYDGDGRYDIAVYRKSNHTFYVLRSSDGGLTAQTWGDENDTPIRPDFLFAVN